MGSLTLQDGRRLDLEVTGPDDGPVFLFHHGTPGSVHQDRSMQRAVHDRGLRLVSYSRAGYGGSTRLAGRSVADVVPDMTAVLDDLGAETCVTAGWSGGGPHALACAALMPDRIAACLVIAGVAPREAKGLEFAAGMGEDNVAEFAAADAGEERLRAFLDEIAPQLRNAQAQDLVESLGSLLPEVDRAVLTDEYGEDIVASFRGALGVGVDGWLDDDLAFVRPWGFDLEEIRVPTTLWQGDADLMVPFAHGEWLAANLPGVRAHLLPGEGHLSVGLGQIEAMLDELCAMSGLSGR